MFVCVKLRSSPRIHDSNRPAIVDAIRARIGAPAPTLWRFVYLQQKTSVAFGAGIGAREKPGEVPRLGPPGVDGASELRFDFEVV